MDQQPIKWHLSNDLVTICPLEMRHSEALQTFTQYYGLFKYMTLDFSTPEKAEAYIKTAEQEWENGITHAFAIEDSSGYLIGTTCIRHISETNRRGEIGWTAYRPEYHGGGYNKHIKWLMLNLCFEYLKYVRVELKTDELNLRSQKAIEKLGALKEGVFRKHILMPNGRWRNTVWYSIIDTDWTLIKTKIFAEFLDMPFNIRHI